MYATHKKTLVVGKAGSGKTTTALLIISELQKRNPDCPILIVAPPESSGVYKKIFPAECIKESFPLSIFNQNEKMILVIDDYTDELNTRKMTKDILFRHLLIYF